MVKPSDIAKLEGAGNYWTWKPDATSLLLADGLWNAVDPSVPVPNGAVQMRAWASNNLKAHGILFFTLSQAVKDKINNADIGINGCLLWVTLESYYTTADPATRSILMSQFHTISHDLSQPADKFLQAVITAERRLTAIAISLPPHMLESPQRDISTMINAINAWETSMTRIKGVKLLQLTSLVVTPVARTPRTPRLAKNLIGPIPGTVRMSATAGWLHKFVVPGLDLNHCFLTTKCSGFSWLGSTTSNHLYKPQEKLHKSLGDKVWLLQSWLMPGFYGEALVHAREAGGPRGII
ncbi:hypothetical protein DFH08DRAFT_811786 [Mycena albidolilacea]|uniref:Uncharacterized protein n=1 Tax=Mycena albidolilacea TaxID=1033008 RepID=A0AAD7ENC5_9AGAR|nr:hypothetical protein DFH08DRAFT_811786 [Mycena albidolilacea]